MAGVVVASRLVHPAEKNVTEHVPFPRVRTRLQQDLAACVRDDAKNKTRGSTLRLKGVFVGGGVCITHPPSSPSSLDTPLSNTSMPQTRKRYQETRETSKGAGWSPPITIRGYREHTIMGAVRLVSHVAQQTGSQRWPSVIPVAVGMKHSSQAVD